MSKRNALFVPAILCFLATLAFLGLKSMGYVFSAGEHGQTAAGITPHPALNESSDQPPQTKRDRHENGDAKALRELEAEFDEILPAQFPEQFSSLCDVTLKSGESLVLGGFRKSDGNYEFTMITVAPNDSGQYTTKATTMVLSPDRTSELGFDALVSPAKTRIQKSLIVDSGAIIGTGNFVEMMTGPYMTAPANTSSTISVGNSESSHVISTLVNPQNDGDSIRLRTRIESPDDFP